MAGSIVIKFYSPVNEGIIGQLLRQLCKCRRGEYPSHEEVRSHLDPGRWLTGRTR